MNRDVLVQGELKIIGQDGKTTVLHAGDVVTKMVDAVHHCESCGTEPVALYMFYLLQGDLPLSVQHPTFRWSNSFILLVILQTNR